MFERSERRTYERRREFADILSRNWFKIYDERVGAIVSARSS